MSYPMLKDYLKPQSATQNAFTRFITNRLQFCHNLWKNLKGKSSTACGKIAIGFILCTLGASSLYNRQMLGRVRQGSVLCPPDFGNGWSRDMLLNMLGTDLYERSGKAQTNFKSTLLNTDSDLAQEITRDPYNFSFTKLRGKYNERALKDALLTNITNFCWSLVQALLM